MTPVRFQNTCGPEELQSGFLSLDRNQKIIVAVLLSRAILVILNATLLSPAFPRIMRNTGVDAPTVQ